MNDTIRRNMRQFLHIKLYHYIIDTYDNCVPFDAMNPSYQHGVVNLPLAHVPLPTGNSILYISNRRLLEKKNKENKLNKRTAIHTPDGIPLIKGSNVESVLIATNNSLTSITLR
jgi:hypothetical protein